MTQQQPEQLEFRHRVAEEDKGYTPVPNAVLLDSRIPAMIRLCYTIIKSYAYGQKCDSHPSQKTLAEQLNVKERSVRYYLEELEILGLVTTEQRGLGKTNVYWIEPLTGLDEHVNKYLQWKADKQKVRQPIASPERQPIAGQDRQPIAEPGGNPLPTNNTSRKNTKEELNTFANAPASQPIPPPINPPSQNVQQEQLIGLPEPLKKILAETQKAQEEPPKESSAKEKVPKPTRKPWSDLTDAMHNAIPEAIRPVGRPHYGVNDKPAKEVHEGGFTPQDVTDYVAWAYVHDKWFCCGGSDGMPILMSMYDVKKNIKAWTVTKGVNGNGQLETGHAANVGTQQTGVRSAGGGDVRSNAAEGSGGPAPRIPSIIPAKPGIPKLAKMSNL
jgi:hypothetical protein